MMRIAYLVTAYRDLRHLQRLCGALRREDPGCLIYVQLDRGSAVAAQALALDLPVHLTRHPVRWGDGSYLLALVDSLRAMAEEPWDWVLLLSGQDYPVRPLDELRRELGRGEHSAFAPVSARLEPGADAPDEVVTRYTYRYVWAHGRWPRAALAVAHRAAPLVERASRRRLRVQPRPRGYGPGLGIRRGATIFTSARSCWMGSDYIAMRRDMTAAVLQLLDAEPEVLEFFAETFVPSEALFPSVLRWIDPDGVANRNFHFMRFGGRANPRLITRDDLPELWDLGVPFARKFDDQSSWVEDALPMHCRPA
jgi:hypothetical protein